MAKPPSVKFSELPNDQRLALLDDVLSKYEHGAPVAELAKAISASSTTLYRYLLQERAEEWKRLQAARAQRDLEEAKAMMRNARDHLELAKGEKLANRAAWELERLDRALYGQKPEDQVKPVSININLGRDPVPETARPEDSLGVVHDTVHGKRADSTPAMPRSGAQAEDAEVIESKPRSEQPKPELRAKKNLGDRSVLQISAPVPLSPKPGDAIDYGAGPGFA